MRRIGAVFALAGLAIGAENLPLIAVLDLGPQGVPENEAAVVSGKLRSELQKFGMFRMVERAQMDEILKEQGFQQSGCTTEECIVTMGQMLGVENMVVGTLGKAGKYYLLTAKITDVATGEIIVTQSVEKKGSIDQMIRSGIAEVADLLTSGFRDYQAKAQVPSAGEAAAEPASEKPRKGKAGRAVLFSSLGVAAVAIPIAIIATRDDAKDDAGTEKSSTDVRIEW